MAVDASGNVYIADAGNNRIREVVKATGIITTFAGNGTAGYSGDGGAATSAKLYFTARRGRGRRWQRLHRRRRQHRIREVMQATGIITTFAGNGTAGGGGDGGPATSAALDDPFGVVVDANGRCVHRRRVQQPRPRSAQCQPDPQTCRPQPGP